MKTLTLHFPDMCCPVEFGPVEHALAALSSDIRAVPDYSVRRVKINVPDRSPLEKNAILAAVSKTGQAFDIAASSGWSDDLSFDRVRITVPEMDCPVEAGEIERELKKAGITDYQIDIMNRRILTSPAAASGVMAAVRSAGYEGSIDAADTAADNRVRIAVPEMDCPVEAGEIERELKKAGIADYEIDIMNRRILTSGDAAHGVVPFENSHAGDVSAVLDLCYNHPGLWVVDVYDLPISQNLLVLPGTQLSDLTRVYSHQQAIAQSETFLKQFGLPATAMPNTAMAAKFVAESGDRTKAAIASVETAALYGLEVLVPSINTDGDNTTRFIVLSREKPTAGNRFSLLFTLDNKPGKLAEVIQVIGASGYDMESIKSRPLPHVPFDYYFYVELVGDPAAEKTAALLRELNHVCRTVRLLGVYTK